MRPTILFLLMLASILPGHQGYIGNLSPISGLAGADSYYNPAWYPGPGAAAGCSAIPNFSAVADCVRKGGVPGFGDFYGYMGLQAAGQLAISNVPIVNQQDYTSCGEAAIAMGWNYRHPQWRLTLPRLESTGQNLGDYFPAGAPGPFGYTGTSPAGMQAIAGFYARKYQVRPPMAGNISFDFGDGFAQLEAKGLLYSQLLAGNPVIVEVTNRIGDPSRTYNDSHYVIVTGMNFDTGWVTYNDPYPYLVTGGSQSGYERSIAWDLFWLSWSRNRDVDPGKGGRPGQGWYMVIN